MKTLAIEEIPRNEIDRKLCRLTGPILFTNVFNPFPNKSWFSRVFSTSLLKTLLGKGEIARNEQFLIFPTMFFFSN